MSTLGRDTDKGRDRTPAGGLQADFVAKVLRAVGLRLVLMLVNFGTAMLLARLLGPGQYGTYVFAFSVMTIAALPGQAGLPLIMVRDIAAHGVDRAWGRVASLLIRSRQMMLGYSVLAIAGFALASGLLADRVGAGQAEALFWAGFVLPGFIVVRVAGASIRGLQRVLAGQIVETLVRPGLLLTGLLTFWLLLGAPGDAGQAMAIHAGAAMLALCVALMMQWRYFHRRLAGIKPDHDTGAILRSIGPLSLIAGMQLIIDRTDILMIRALRSPEEVGYYQVALQWAGLVLFSQQAVLFVSGPRVARDYRREDLAAVQATLTRAARFMVLGALPVALILLVFGRQIIALTFGPSYLPAFAALVILVLGAAVQASFGAIIQLAKMVRWEGLLVRMVAAAAVLNIALNALLIPRLGIEGAAWASILATLLWTGALVVIAERRLGLRSFPVAGSRGD